MHCSTCDHPADACTWLAASVLSWRHLQPPAYGHMPARPQLLYPAAKTWPALTKTAATLLARPQAGCFLSSICS